MSDDIIVSNLNDEFHNAKNRKQRKFISQKQKRSANKTITASTFNSGVFGSDALSITPEYFIPQLENSSLELPHTRQEILSWCDYWYQTNELIASAIDTHVTMSVSDFAITCPDQARQEEYEMILEDLNYYDLLSSIAFEYFRVGNAFPMGRFNDDDGTWDEFHLIQAIDIELFQPPQGKKQIYLVPNESIKQMENSPNPYIKDHYKQLPDTIKSAFSSNKPIVLNDKAVSHIRTSAMAGTIWGVPPVFRCFKTLVLKDKLFRSQEAIADGLIAPTRIISVRGANDMPVGEDELEDLRNQFVEADFDPAFAIFTSVDVRDQSVGLAGKMLPIAADLDMIERNISSGMKISKALLHGEGPTYANAQVYQQAMTFYYNHFRKQLERWLIYKVFMPIAEVRGYRKGDSREDISKLSSYEKRKRLILPTIVWRGTGGVDSQKLSILKELHRDNHLSTETFLKFIDENINPEEERVKITREKAQQVALNDVSPEIANKIEPLEEVKIKMEEEHNEQMLEQQKMEIDLQKEQMEQYNQLIEEDPVEESSEEDDYIE